MSEQRTVCVTMTGEFSITYRGRTIHAPRGRDTYSWQLLKYMMAYPDRWIPQQELLVELWPKEQYSEDPSGTLRVRLRRLREMLDKIGLGDSLTGLILYAKDKYRVSPSYAIKSDLEQIDQLCRILQQKDLPPEAGLMFCRQAIELFSGEYLEHTRRAPWVETGDKHCRLLFQTIAERSLRLAEQCENPALVVQLAEKIPVMLPEDHALSTAVMTYLIDAGCVAETLSFFADLTKISELRGLEPVSLSPFFNRSLNHENEDPFQ